MNDYHTDYLGTVIKELKKKSKFTREGFQTTTANESRFKNSLITEQLEHHYEYNI